MLCHREYYFLWCFYRTEHSLPSLSAPFCISVQFHLQTRNQLWSLRGRLADLPVRSRPVSSGQLHLWACFPVISCRRPSVNSTQCGRDRTFNLPQFVSSLLVPSLITADNFTTLPVTQARNLCVIFDSDPFSGPRIQAMA